MTSSPMPSDRTGGPSLRDQLIDSHPQAERIRLILETAYRAYSLRHKNGLDALSWLLGPMAPLGFSMVNEHRSEQNRKCNEAVERLLQTLGNSLADRRIIALLLDDYPGRDPAIALMLRQHLQQS
ncbi:MAG: hypothetical protein VKI83_08935 [Synechococcaceae cyanobacterium]|nr:hypothetical protein [Synechococcaceae cyanobacterium]